MTEKVSSLELDLESVQISNEELALEKEELETEKELVDLEGHQKHLRLRRRVRDLDLDRGCTVLGMHQGEPEVHLTSPQPVKTTQKKEVLLS